MNILLNVTSRELQKISGDVSFYRDLLAADGGGEHRYTLVPDSLSFLRQPPKVWERLAAKLPASQVRRSLFCAARRRRAWLTRPPVECDLVLSHITMPSGGPAGTPVIWSTQGLSPADYYDRAGPVGLPDVLELYERYSADCDALLVWTESGARRLRDQAKLSAPIVELPPVLPRRHSVQPLERRCEAPHLLFVGRDAARKGLNELAAALKGLAMEFPNLAIDIVSAPSPSLRAELERIPGTVLHEDPSDETVAALMARADLLALPTKAETYGYVLVEAMSNGCALLTTDLSPMNELVVDGVNGITVQPGNSTDIETKLGNILRSPEALAAMGAASRAHYRSLYAPEVTIPRYHALYEDVLRGRLGD